MEKFIKVILSALLLFCLFDLPYGYYQLVRFIALIGFSILAYHSNKQNNQIETIIYIALAILFQPFFKIALGREIWNIADVFIALGLLISIFREK